MAAPRTSPLLAYRKPNYYEPEEEKKGFFSRLMRMSLPTAPLSPSVSSPTLSDTGRQSPVDIPHTRLSVDMETKMREVYSKNPDYGYAMRYDPTRKKRRSKASRKRRTRRSRRSRKHTRK